MWLTCVFFVVQITCQGKDGRIETAITDYRQGIFSADWFACFLCAYVHRCFLAFVFVTALQMLLLHIALTSLMLNTGIKALPL